MKVKYYISRRGDILLIDDLEELQAATDDVWGEDSALAALEVDSNYEPKKGLYTFTTIADLEELVVLFK